MLIVSIAGSCLLASIIAWHANCFPFGIPMEFQFFIVGALLSNNLAIDL